MRRAADRESTTLDRTWAPINLLLFCATNVSTGMASDARLAFRNWIGNKIVFPEPFGNILKDRFRNLLGAREEISSDGEVALPPVAPAADYSHSIVLGGFEEMS
jgi:hypothetical protein